MMSRYSDNNLHYHHFLRNEYSQITKFSYHSNSDHNREEELQDIELFLLKVECLT